MDIAGDFSQQRGQLAKISRLPEAASTATGRQTKDCERPGEDYLFFENQAVRIVCGKVLLATHRPVRFFSERRQSLTELICRTMQFEILQVSSADLRSQATYFRIRQLSADTATGCVCAVPNAIACVGVKCAAASKRILLPPR